MTVQTAHPGHHISTKSAAGALAGAALAVAAGFGIATVVLDEATSPPAEISPDVTGRDDNPGFDPNGFAGTDREERALAHRNR